MNCGYTIILPLYINVFGTPLQHYTVTNLNSEDFELGNSKDASDFDLLNYTHMCTCTHTHTHTHKGMNA
jgi:hypothetical protein